MKIVKYVRFAALASAVLLASACGGGGGGNTPPPPADTTPPDTTLAGVPAALTNTNSASISFSATEGGSTFESRLDNGSFAAATSPQTLTGLSEGAHTFQVRARDAAGNVDVTPASATWTVDTVAPQTQIDAAPSTSVPVNTASFSVSSEANAVIEASVDGGAYAQITSPFAPAGLADGAHTASFRARDAAGNVDTTPATTNWTLDLTPPAAAILFPLPVSYTDASTLTVRGTASDANTLASVSVAGVAATTTDGFLHWSAVVPIPGGSNALTATVSDVAGNVRTTTAVNVSNRGPVLSLPRGLDYDLAGNQILVADQNTGEVYAFRASDGVGRLLSPSASGSTAVEELVADSINNRALLVDWGLDALVAVNLSTGARTTVSTGSGAVPTQLSIAFGIAHDPVGNRAFVTARGNNSVIGVNLATGARTVVSSGTVGTGTPFTNPLGIVYDNASTPGSPRLLVADAAFGAPRVVSVDIATGNRTNFSAAGAGSGPMFSAPVSMKLDTTGPLLRVLMLDTSDDALFALTLSNGDRSILGNEIFGSGEALDASTGLALNPSLRRAYSAQVSGEILSTDLATQVRSTLVHSNAGTGPKIFSAGGLAIEQASGTPTSLLLAEGDAQRLLRINLANGDRSVASGAVDGGTVGNGLALHRGTDVVLDRRPSAGGNAALVLAGSPGNVIVAVNLTTGDRTLVANLNSTAPVVNQPRNLALDVAGNRVLFTDNDNSGANADVLYAVDLTTGVRSVISSTTVGTGTSFELPTDLVLEPAANPTRAIIANGAGNGQLPNLLAVSLANGNRSVLVPSSGGAGGVNFTLPGPLFLDSLNSRLIATNIYLPHLFAVPLPSASRQLVSGTNPGLLTVRGTGPTQQFASGLDVDVASDIAFVATANNRAVMAIDLISGDRVLISH